MIQSRPAGRYPTPSRWQSARWVPLALGVVVVAVGVAVAWLAFTIFGPKDIEGKQVSYQVVNDSTMSVRFTVTRDEPGRAAVCIIRARSKDGTETGRREVLVGPSSSGTVELSAPVRTSAPPAVGDVYGCSYDVPEYLQPVE